MPGIWNRLPAVVFPGLYLGLTLRAPVVRANTSSAGVWLHIPLFIDPWLAGPVGMVHLLIELVMVNGTAS
jgi:hypothetical protein